MKGQAERKWRDVLAGIGRSLDERPTHYPTNEEFGRMSALEFNQFKLSEFEGWDRESPDYFRTEGAVDFIKKLTRKMSSEASERARKPRPSRQHPRKAEALKLARAIADRNPGMKPASIAVNVAAQMKGDDVPNQEVIARWIRKERP